MEFILEIWNNWLKDDDDTEQDEVPGGIPSFPSSRITLFDPSQMLMYWKLWYGVVHQFWGKITQYIKLKKPRLLAYA